VGIVERLRVKIDRLGDPLTRRFYEREWARARSRWKTHDQCKIWYWISRTVSDDDAHCGDIDDRSVRAFAVKPRLGAPPCGIGLDRSARPSKSGDRAANALTAMLR
jgi:hypothetical protein